ncbi:MAG TPA: AsnC family transcriptional regulator, partial [Solirubrobacteraceae bacterium]|nr:AsnC family transcriptional regulator [Solirubrobacteraceae bacterium]
MAGRAELSDTPAPLSDVGDPTRPTTAPPKLRSRKDGAAVALDELDRKLLNLMQGRFPIEPRPYRAVAALAGVAEQEAMARVQRLLDKRIIRQVTPIFDTRALGYSSMLVAAKVDPEHPHRAAQVINAHPGVSHNYLRNHDFNLWFTIATEPDSQLGLEGTLQVLAREAGAESVRQLPTLKLFKIRMDLEMEGDTDALASAAAEVAEPVELDPQPYDELDVAVIRALQGDMPVVPEPYAPAAAQVGVSEARFLERLAGMQQRGLLRRVAAILYHRRAGFSANGMGVWKVPDERIAEVGCRMAAVRGVSHCYQRPTYEDWPYSV